MERLLPPLHRSLAFIVLANTSGSPAADSTGREQKRTKAGYHHGDGILPFVLISASMWSVSVYSVRQKNFPYRNTYGKLRNSRISSNRRSTGSCPWPAPTSMSSQVFVFRIFPRYASPHCRRVTKYCHDIIIIGIGDFRPRPQNLVGSIITNLFVFMKIIQSTM